MKLHRIAFKVYQTPYMVWGDRRRLHAMNRRFVDGISVDQFGLPLDHLESEIEDPENQEAAALAIRGLYFHATETFLSLLCAALQAPDFVQGWISKYSLADLRKCIQDISRNEPFFTKFSIEDSFSWESIVDIVHYAPEHPGWETELKMQFANFWRSIAEDFLGSHHADEYNALKHGLRHRFGSVSVTLGPEESIELPGGPFGSTFYVPERIHSTNRNHFQMNRITTNWNPHWDIAAIRLLCTSIFNLRGFLTPVNRPGSNPVQFEIPRRKWLQDFAALERPELKAITIGSPDLDISPDTLPTPESINAFLDRSFPGRSIEGQ